MQQQTRLISNCIALLEQVASLVERIPDEVYSGRSKLTPRGSIGGHLRHCLDFYQSFLSGIECGRIDYNIRERNSLMERNRSRALQRIRATIGGLRSVSPTYGTTRLLVSIEDYGVSLPSWCGSSVVRELEFLQSHTIHHYSLVAMLLRLNGIEPGEEFGVAPSTLNYWRGEAACVR